jgi:hypothetical protein
MSSNDPVKTGQAATATGSGYDRLGILGANGEMGFMTRADYEKLPLSDRIRLLVGGTLKFFRNGQEISPREALRGG